MAGDTAGLLRRDPTDMWEQSTIIQNAVLSMHAGHSTASPSINHRASALPIWTVQAVRLPSIWKQSFIADPIPAWIQPA